MLKGIWVRDVCLRRGICGQRAQVAQCVPFLPSLAEGASIQDILDDFPTLTERAVRAVIAFAASSAEEGLPLPSIPHIA
jgi:uncharacterized protein (DUF433 family)